MDALPLITALGGAFIGAVGSLSGILIQSRNQARREMRTLAVQFARDDFHARVQDQSGKLDATTTTDGGRGSSGSMAC